MNFNLEDRTIILAVGGSRAYGLHTEYSDVDVKGVCVPTKEYYHGFMHHFEQADNTSNMETFIHLLSQDEKNSVSKTKIEGSVYEVTKFINLAADCNPNFLDVLFCRDEEVRFISPLGRKLRDNKDLFISAKSKFTFAGYSHGQLQRIKSHRAFLLNPPKAKPTRPEFGLPETTLLPKDQLAAANDAVKKKIDSWELDLSEVPQSTIVHIQGKLFQDLAEMQVALGYSTTEDMKWEAAARSIGLDDNLMEVMQKERKYDAAFKYYKQYEEWKRNRNPERAILEEKYSMDTKHAAHLVRLLRMGKEILTTGKVHVWRGLSNDSSAPNDRDELLAIRNGAWTYDQLIQWAEQEEKELNQLYTNKKFSIPKSPDRIPLDQLCIEIVESML